VSPIIDASLQLRIRELEAENLRLRERIDFLEGVPSLRAGMHGELLIAELLQGRITTHTAPHDVVLSEGLTIEVKFARLNTPNLRFPNSQRWSWAHPLGQKGGKIYHRLLLIAEADPRYRDLYRDPMCPYVLFDVPFSEVKYLNSPQDLIQMTTDPNRTGSGRRMRLFNEFQTTLAELKNAYGIKTPFNRNA